MNADGAQRSGDPSAAACPCCLSRAWRRVWFSFLVTSLSIYIVASISWRHPVAMMVNGYDVKTPVGHEESNSYSGVPTPPNLRAESRAGSARSGAETAAAARSDP